MAANITKTWTGNGFPSNLQYSITITSATPTGNSSYALSGNSWMVSSNNFTYFGSTVTGTLSNTNTSTGTLQLTLSGATTGSASCTFMISGQDQYTTVLGASGPAWNLTGHYTESSCSQAPTTGTMALQ